MGAVEVAVAVVVADVVEAVVVVVAAEVDEAVTGVNLITKYLLFFSMVSCLTSTRWAPVAPPLWWES